MMIEIDLNKEMLHSIIKTTFPTPVTGHRHLVIVTENLETGILKLYSAIMHPNNESDESITQFSKLEYKSFLDQWINNAPFAYSIVEVNSSDPEVVERVLYKELGNLQDKELTSRKRKNNPFLRGNI